MEKGYGDSKGVRIHPTLKTPEHTELEKLRLVVGDGSKMNVAGAFKILSKYKG